MIVWLSCDQSTIGNFTNFASCVDKIVCISEFHKLYFQSTYNIDVNKMSVIDIPVRYQDFEQFHEEKIKNRFIFTSVPARGLDNLHRIWGKIVEAVPDASLAITSDYRLWGVGPSNEQFRTAWLRKPNILYFGAMDRASYIREVMKAQICLYQSSYDELFCVAISECEALGVYPITSSTGALPTTNMGTVIEGNGDSTGLDQVFLDNALELVRDEERLKQLQEEVKQKSLERFSIQNILSQWDRVLEIQ
jgi:glycosyltransferase involved in cell wall biosynthesis